MDVEVFNRFIKVLGPLIKESREANGLSLTTVASIISTSLPTLTLRKLEAGDDSVYPGLYFSAWSLFLDEIPEDKVLEAMQAEVVSSKGSVEIAAKTPSPS